MWRLILPFLIGGLSLCLCPSACSCSSNTFECSACLQTYFRRFNSSISDCQCMASYVEMLPPQPACSPANCTAYDSQGCVSCGTNWVLSFSDQFQIYVCVCQTNYYLDNGNCICLSNLLSSLYYQSISQDYCNACPSDCTCDPSGCTSCDSSTLRTIVDDSGLSICPCSSPYV